MEATIIMSLNSTPSRSLGRIPLCIINCKTYSSWVNSPFPYAWLWSQNCLSSTEGGATSPALQPGSELTGQEISDPSEPSSLLLPALSPTHQKLWMLISRLPDVHLFGIVPHFTALSCLQSAQGTQWPCVGLRPRRDVCLQQHTRIWWVSSPAPTVDPLAPLQA